MNVRTDRQIDRQTDRPHELHVYVGLAQARPNKKKQKKNKKHKKQKHKKMK